MHEITLGSCFHDVTYVVTDLGRAVERFTSLVPGAAFSTASNRMHPVRTGAVAGKAADPIELLSAAAPMGPHAEYEIHLVQPLGRDPIFHRFLTSEGPGLHHIGFRVHDLEPALQSVARNAALVAELRGEDGKRHLYYLCEAIGGLIEVSGATGDPHPSGKPAAGSLASYFTQVAYVVNDIAAARRWAEETLGCEIASARDIVQGPSWNLHFRGQPARHEFGLKMVIGKLGPTGEGQIELLEPQRNENVLAEFLTNHGPGLNHVAFVVPDYETLTRALRSTGVPPLKEIHVPGTVHSSYFDCTREEFATIEVFETGPHA